MSDTYLEKCVHDFNQFIEFNETERPLLSAKKGVFGKKDSFRLNGMLENQKPVSVPNFNQDQYYTIDLMFDLALQGKLYYKGTNSEGKSGLIKTPRLEDYLALNNFEKYVFLLQTYWTKYEFLKKFDRWIPISSFYNFLVHIVNAKPGQDILKDENHQTHKIYAEAAVFQHHLRFFGMGEPELIAKEKWTYDDTIRAFIPNSFGIEIATFLCTEALVYWNREDILHLLYNSKKALKNKKNDSFEIFQKIFPKDTVTNTAKEIDNEDFNGVYCFKVSLSKAVWRKIKLSGKHTLGDLHHAIQDAYQFDDDHLYAFYIGGNRKTGTPVYCEYAREGGKAAEKLTIEELKLFKGQKLLYLFDFGDIWEFSVDLIEIEKETPMPLSPTLVEAKGDSPEQYRCDW